ncbi:uncharacterized protein [Branchiostoma lanceolatum]|uniref:uncharacterized protein isoform X1 n=1 Tax=Branchiostoma lanceolatum TaxID=7740 RepID=UPI0034544A67
MQEEGARSQERVLTKASDKKEESTKSETDDDRVNTPYETRMRVKRQKIMKEAVESRTSPACLEQEELVMDASEEDTDEVADGDAQEQAENKRTTDDVEFLGSRRGTELRVSVIGRDIAKAGTSADQRKQSVRVTDIVAEEGQRRMRKQNVRDDNVVAEELPTTKRKQNVRDADMTAEGPTRVRKQNLRITDDVTEEGPTTKRKQNVRDADIVTEEGPIAMRMRTRLGAVREAVEETTEGGVTRLGDGRGNQHVGLTDVTSNAGDGGELTTKPPWRDGRRRRCRTKYSKEQLMAMEELFMRNRYPDIVEREDLAERIRLTEDRIQVWFQNRRSRWRARERKMQKAAEGAVTTSSQHATGKPDGPNSSTGTSSQPGRPLPVLIIPAAGFPLMQQYFSAMSGNVTDGANDHRSAGIPMMVQCPPADQAQHAQGTAPSTSSSAEATNVTTSSTTTKPTSNVTTTSTVTKPRTIAPKLDPQKLPFPYTIGFAYFPSQTAGTKGLANREGQTVSASLVIPANQGQLGSVQGHRGGGAGPTLSPLLRAVESELQANHGPVSVAPATPSNVAKTRNSSNIEACSSSMQLRSRSIRPIAPMPTGRRTTQRRHSTGCRYPLPAEDPQEQTVGDGPAGKTQVDSMVTSQSVTPVSAIGHRSGIARQRGDSRPCTSTLRSLGTGFTRIDHSGRIQAPDFHESSHDSMSSPVPFQPILRRRARTFSEGSGGCVPTGCYLSNRYTQSRNEGAYDDAEAANSSLPSSIQMRRPASLQIPQPQRQGCRVKMTTDNQGVILEDRSSTEIFRVPPRRRANSLTQPVFRQDATPTLKAPAIPVNYGLSAARGSRMMPQALFEDMHSPPPRARVASLSGILPCSRQNEDKHTSIFRKERPDHQPAVHSTPSTGPTVPQMSDVISLAFRTVNSPVQSTTKSAGMVRYAPVTRNTISGSPSPVAANKGSPGPPGKRDESVHGGDDVVFVEKVSCPSKPEAEQDNTDRDNANFVILESSNASQAGINHVELMPCTDTVEKVHDGNNNMSPLEQMKNVVDSIDKPDMVAVHHASELARGQDHDEQPYSSMQQGGHEHVTTFGGLMVGEDAAGNGMTTDVEVHGGGLQETCGHLAAQEQVPAETWMEDNANPSTSSIYETPVAASSENIRYMHMQTLNQHQPYTSGSTNSGWSSDTLQNNSDVPVAFAPTMSRASQQCLYTGTTSFQNRSHHGSSGPYGRLVQPWAGDPTQTQQQGAGNITMNTLFLWQQNINLAQQVSLTNILARHNLNPKPHMLFANHTPASIPTTTNEQSLTSMVSHHPLGLGATPRPVGDYYTSSSTKLTYVNSNRNWFGLNSQGLPPTSLPGVQRMNDQGVLPGQLSGQGFQTFHK